MLKTLGFRYCALYFFAVPLHRRIKSITMRTERNQAVERLESQGIPYVLQPAGQQNLNVYFGRRECLDAIRLIVTRPLNQ